MVTRDKNFDMSKKPLTHPYECLRVVPSYLRIPASYLGMRLTRKKIPCMWTRHKRQLAIVYRCRPHSYRNSIADIPRKKFTTGCVTSLEYKWTSRQAIKGHTHAHIRIHIYYLCWRLPRPIEGTQRVHAWRGLKEILHAKWIVKLHGNIYTHSFNYELGIAALSGSQVLKTKPTRKLCYRKDDRAMRAII